MITTELVSVDDYVPRFRPAIREDSPISSRSADWFTVRFDYHSEILFFRLLKVIGLDYRYFTFKQMQSRRRRALTGEKYVERPWFPGYAFIEMDVKRDFWQQLFDFPGFIAFLGSPTSLPSGAIDDIEPSLLGVIPARDPGAKFAVGDTVRPASGLFERQTAVIISIEKEKASFWVFLFGRPNLVSMSFADIVRVA